MGETLVSLAAAKTGLARTAAVTRGILCNALVCLAVWLCMGARSVADKVLAVLFPITAFIACGFEHSLANMFFLPLGLAVARSGGGSLGVAAAWSNLALVTLGNILGGTILVALVYRFVYLRRSDGAAEEGLR